MFLLHPKYRPFAISILIALLFMGSAIAKDRLRLIHADQLESRGQGQRTLKILTGDVHFEKGELTLRCDLALWQEADDIIDFYHNVRLIQNEKTLSCDTLIYFNQTDIAEAYGNVIIEQEELQLRARQAIYNTETEVFTSHQEVYLIDEKRQLQADHLRYYSQEDKAVALQRAQIIDNQENSILRADSILYFRENGDIFATRNPELIRSDSSGSETFRILAKSIEAYENRGDFFARDSVRVLREDFSAFADLLYYNDSLEIATLTGTPQVFSDSQELSGDTIRMILHDEKIHSVRILNNALATSHTHWYLPIAVSDSIPTHSRDSVAVQDEISGQQMDIFFRQGRTDSIAVAGMATSIYHVAEDSLLQGTNHTSGDSVRMKFDDEKLQLIRVIGGTRGQFIPHKTNAEVDTTIVYASEKIDYFLQDRITHLIEDASIQYGDMDLTAGQITLEWDKNILTAIPSTATGDSLVAQRPTFQQGRQSPFSGDKMIYNLRTQKGRIVQGKTEVEDGFYYGNRITKTGKDEFYVSDGIYTTCDKEDHPHYYFKSRRMKLIPKDKIIAKPIVLYIHDIPLIGLPFAVIPDQSGKRHSGWILPTYGENANVGGFIKGLGYFWAPNDFSDFRLTTDFFDKKGIILHYRTRYALRYKFNGSISGSYSNEFLAPFPKKQWSLQINHSQNLSPSARFSANGSFVSNDSYFKELGIQRDTRLNQQLISNATFSKNWPGQPYSLSVNLNQTHNLQAQTKIASAPAAANQRVNYINRSLPNVSFNRSSKPLIPQRSGASAANAKWYNNIYFSLNSRFKNRQDVYYLSDYNEADSLYWDQRDLSKNGITHGINLNSSQRVLKYISLNQTLNISEDWLMDYELPLRDANGHVIVQNNELITERISGFLARHTGSFSLNAQTKLYGLFPLRLGKLRAFRHVATPSVGLRFRPDFSEPIGAWDPGYIRHYTDSLNNRYEFDPFQGSIVGATPSGEQKSLTLSLSNVFQAKTQQDDQEKKLDLFTLNSSTSLNFAADSLNWAPINTSLRTQITKKVGLNLSLRHDLYAYRGKRVNDWNDTLLGIPIPRLVSASASTGFSLSGKRFGKEQEQTQPADSLQSADSEMEPETDAADYIANPLAPASGGDFWTARFSFRYSLNQNNPDRKSESFFMTTNINLKLTENWNIGYRANFDLMTRELVSQDISVHRDLHCWELSFSWTPTGYGQQYSLIVNVKSPSLKDLKYEERGGRMRGYGY